MKWVEAPHFLKDDVIADVPRLLILGKKIYSLCYYLLQSVQIKPKMSSSKKKYIVYVIICYNQFK